MGEILFIKIVFVYVRVCKWFSFHFTICFLIQFLFWQNILFFKTYDVVC